MTKSNKPRSSEYTNSDIAVMAVYHLGGALHHIHLEDVAMKAAQLAPKKFCWKKYPEQINLESVRITLKNELRATNRRVAGSIRDGYMLTPEGLSWCLSNTGTEDNQALGELRKEVDRAKKTSTFGKVFTGEGEVSIGDIESLLRIDQYFTPRKRRERTLALLNASVLDAELKSALDKVRERGFKELEVAK